MKRQRIFSRAVLLFVVFHVFLMTVYYEATREKTPFLFFVGHIFRPEPTKSQDVVLILFPQIDGQSIEPPQDILKLRGYFPEINGYDLAGKVHDLGVALRNQQHDTAEHIRIEVEKDLLKTHSRVDYEIIHHFVNPIDFVREGRAIKSETVWRGQAKAPG